MQNYTIEDLTDLSHDALISIVLEQQSLISIIDTINENDKRITTIEKKLETCTQHTCTCGYTL
jgi:hypothetical protein